MVNYMIRDLFTHAKKSVKLQFICEISEVFMMAKLDTWQDSLCYGLIVALCSEQYQICKYEDFDYENEVFDLYPELQGKEENSVKLLKDEVKCSEFITSTLAIMRSVTQLRPFITISLFAQTQNDQDQDQTKMTIHQTIK